MLHDLTLDCNASGNPKFRDGIGAVGAVNVVGNNILFSDLKIEHFGTGKRGVECFPLWRPQQRARLFVTVCFKRAGH